MHTPDSFTVRGVGASAGSGLLGGDHRAPSGRADVEARIGIQPIEELLDERRTHVEKAASLRARYGPFGTWDHERKTRIAGIKATIRAQYARDGVKVTEAQLDDEAHGHPDYKDFIVQATRDRAEWIRAENKIQDVNDLIQRDAAIARHVAAEARLGG